MILLTADMMELKANPDRAAKGTVIEARLDKGMGPVATVLVQERHPPRRGHHCCRHHRGPCALHDGRPGRRVKEAGPSVPVEITGLGDVPVGGDIFNAVSDERLARELVEQRINERKEEQFNSQTKVTLDNLFEQMKEGDMKELKIIVKADVQGSVEAVRQSWRSSPTTRCGCTSSTGRWAPSAKATSCWPTPSNAIIVGFNVRPTPWPRRTPSGTAWTCGCTASSTTASRRLKAP